MVVDFYIFISNNKRGNKIFINNQWISLESIRNIQLLQEEKWFQIHVFTNNRMQIVGKNPNPTSSPIEENDTLDTEITWIEDFNQSEEWIVVEAPGISSHLRNRYVAYGCSAFFSSF